MEDGKKYDSMNIQDISKQITLSQHMHHTFPTIDINTEICYKPCSYYKPAVRERKKTCWKSFYMHVLQQQDFINEQKVNEPNPLYSLANITKQHVT
jgi:hypothetical protein